MGRATRLTEDMLLPRHWLSEALRQGMTTDEALHQFEQMKDWSIGSPRGAKLDWFATWRRWVRQEMRRVAKREPKRDQFVETLEEMKRGKRG
jgi:hypothetical protein